MADYDFEIKRGDRLPTLQATFTDATGAAVDLTSATIKFLMRPTDSATAKVNAAASAQSPATDGVALYAWAAVDTDTPGDYAGEFEVTFASGKKATFPSTGYIAIRVWADVG